MRSCFLVFLLLSAGGCATTDVRQLEPRTVREPVRVVVSPTGGLFADFGAAYDGDVQVKASGPNWGRVTLKTGARLAADGTVCDGRTEIFSYTGAEEDAFVLKDAKGVRYVYAECTMLSELNSSSVRICER